MSIAVAVKHMLAAGMPHEAIVAAISEMEASAEPKRSAGAIRQQRYRERHKASPVTVGDVCDAGDAVIPSQDKGPQTPKNSTLPTPQENPPKGGQKKGFALRPDWTADERDLEYAARKGLAEPQLSRQIEKFRDYHLARRTLMKDWNAAWRTWCNSDFITPHLTPPSPSPEATGPPQPPPGAPSEDELRRRYARMMDDAP